MIVVVTPDPDDAARVAWALSLLERQLRVDGSRLPETLDCPVVHAYDARRCQETTKVADTCVLPDGDFVPLLLTYDEAAARINASKRTVQRLVSKGSLTAKRLGRRSYIDPADLDQFVAGLPTTNRTA